MSPKIASLNLCLGLKNKKLLISEILKTESIDIMCVQETEIESSFNIDLLNIKGYTLEMEINCLKSRVGIYIKNDIKYVRKYELEGTNSHILIIDVTNKFKTYRIINIYRSFSPQEGISAREKFRHQLGLIKEALTNETVLIGDFNLDYCKRFDITYSHRNLFEDFEEVLSDENLVQLVKFKTWLRVVELTVKSSTLDHVYVKDISILDVITHIKPCFGDHELIMFNVNDEKIKPNCEIRRDWRYYSKDVLLTKLSASDWEFDYDSVQDYWNHFENQLLGIVDSIIPYVEFKDNLVKSVTPPNIKNKINIRKRLLKKLKITPTLGLKTRIKNINAEIKIFFYSRKRISVRKGIMPGNSKSLWRAVSIAKDVGQPRIPVNMKYNNEIVTGVDVCESFVKFFEGKVNSIVSNVNIDPNIHNGGRKIFANDSMFMTREDIITSVKSLKTKNCEGYDRIPQRVLIDGLGVLVEPLTKFFEKVYRDFAIPGQWLISKIIPVHKKGSKGEIVNYRPVANLCSASKIFEKMILNRIRRLEALNGVELGGKQQHGFTKNKSTLTAGLLLQSLIARALDDDKFVALASIDLSAAFDIVNVGLLIKRLKILGLPNDLVKLIEMWLKERHFYVCVGGHASTMSTTWYGIIQGSILGPILYAIFISPIFEIENLTCFADDKFALAENKDKSLVKFLIQKKLERVIDWLSKSGMKVNEAKTDLCLFYKLDTTPISILLNGQTITSNNKINVLGVIFDSKMQWTEQVAQTLNKANSALCAIRMINKYFNSKELLNLITSNFYSILFYNSEIWHLPSLNHNLKQKLLSLSAKAIKVCYKHCDPMISFLRLHEMAGRATPEKIMQYKLAISLFKLYNANQSSLEFINLNFAQILTSRQVNFVISKNNRFKVGINALCNRLYVLNMKIPLSWLNQSIDTYKVKCKKVFL